MAVKTITITEEAYYALKQLKLESESFSEGILRASHERKGNLSQFLGILRNSRRELREMKARIKKRREDIEREARGRMLKIRRRLDDRS